MTENGILVRQMVVSASFKQRILSKILLKTINQNDIVHLECIQ